MSNTFARELRKSMTDAERKLWRGLRMRQLHGYKFRRQFSLGKYIADFVCLEARLVIEVDGGQHAEERYGDAERDEWLRSQGFRVLRYWNNQVLGELDGVLEDIARALKDHTPHPGLPPQGGEGWDGGGGYKQTKNPNFSGLFLQQVITSDITSGNQI